MTSSEIADGMSVEPVPLDDQWPAEAPSIPVVSRDASPVEQSTAPLWELATRDFAAWRMGDDRALDRLVRRLTPTLWHLARAHDLDRASAEDVVQGTWLAMVRHAGSIRDERAFLQWLTVTARREAWRVSGTSRREDSLQPEMLETAAPTAPTVDDEIVLDAESRALWRNVARLPDRCRRLLRTVAFDDRPNYREIAADLDMPHGTIGPTRQRCLGKLRRLLAADAEWSE
jgi:RNA polymerase sigma factor (sigma-70 family)